MAFYVLAVITFLNTFLGTHIYSSNIDLFIGQKVMIAKSSILSWVFSLFSNPFNFRVSYQARLSMADLHHFHNHPISISLYEDHHVVLFLTMLCPKFSEKWRASSSANLFNHLISNNNLILKNEDQLPTKSQRSPILIFLGLCLYSSSSNFDQSYSKVERLSVCACIKPWGVVCVAGSCKVRLIPYYFSRPLILTYSLLSVPSGIEMTRTVRVWFIQTLAL